MNKGNLLQTSHGIYYPSVLAELGPVLRKFSGKKFIDIGSGFGEVVQMAINLGMDAYGIEAASAMWEHSSPRHRIIFGDAREHNYSSYDVAYYYLQGCSDELKLFEAINKAPPKELVFGCWEVAASHVQSCKEQVRVRNIILVGSE